MRWTDGQTDGEIDGQTDGFAKTQYRALLTRDKNDKKLSYR